MALQLVGQRFGRLLVISGVGSGCWSCVCDCGTPHIASTILLQMGHCKSCGCLRVENCRRAQTFAVAALRERRQLRKNNPVPKTKCALEVAMRGWRRPD